MAYKSILAGSRNAFLNGCPPGTGSHEPGSEKCFTDHMANGAYSGNELTSGSGDMSGSGMPGSGMSASGMLASGMSGTSEMSGSRDTSASGSGLSFGDHSGGGMSSGSGDMPTSGSGTEKPHGVTFNI